MGFIDFTNGEVLTADQMDLVMRQGIMRFADATARDTALSAVLAEGMMAYLDDTDEVLKYDGTDWIDISGDITGVTAGTALTGGGTSGDVTLNVDESALTIAQSQVTDLVSDLDDKQDDVITTQGDLVIGDGSGDPVRLPVGSADQVLTSDGTTVSFQNAGGGGGQTLISTTSLSGSNSVTITNIPQDYKDLRILVKDYSIDSPGTGRIVAITFNSTTDIYGFGNIGEGTSDSNREYLPLTGTVQRNLDGGFLDIELPAYSTSQYKLAKAYGIADGGSLNFIFLTAKMGQADLTNPISSVTLVTLTGSTGSLAENFLSGTAEIYGVS